MCPFLVFHLLVRSCSAIQGKMRLFVSVRCCWILTPWWTLLKEGKCVHVHVCTQTHTHISRTLRWARYPVRAQLPSIVTPATTFSHTCADTSWLQMERRLGSLGKSILSMARNWRQGPQREIKIPWKRRQVWKFDQWSGDLGMNGRGSKLNPTCSFYIDENLIILHEDQRFFCFSSIRLCATLLTIAHQAPLSMGFSRQTYWSGLLCSPPRDVPNPGIGPRSPALQWILYHLSHQGSPKE